MDGTSPEKLARLPDARGGASPLRGGAGLLPNISGEEDLGNAGVPSTTRGTWLYRGCALQTKLGFAKESELVVVALADEGGY